jgi:hypothetical protein
MIFPLLWPLLTLLAAAGLCVIAPRGVPSRYLRPISCTAAFICLLAALGAAIVR